MASHVRAQTSSSARRSRAWPCGTSAPEVWAEPLGSRCWWHSVSPPTSSPDAKLKRLRVEALLAPQPRGVRVHAQPGSGLANQHLPRLDEPRQRRLARAVAARDAAEHLQPAVWIGSSSTRRAPSRFPCHNLLPSPASQRCDSCGGATCLHHAQVGRSFALRCATCSAAAPALGDPSRIGSEGESLHGKRSSSSDGGSEGDSDRHGPLGVATLNAFEAVSSESTSAAGFPEKRIPWPSQ